MAGGFLPVRQLHGAPWNGNLTKWPIDEENDTTAIFRGDLVTLASGFATRATGAASQSQLGIFMGCEYEDPGAPGGWRFANSFPGSDVGYAVRAVIVPTNGLVMSVPVTGTLAASNYGGRFTVTMGSGNASTGISTATVAIGNANANGPIQLLSLDTGQPADPAAPGIGAGTRRMQVICALNSLLQ